MRSTTQIVLQITADIVQHMVGLIGCAAFPWSRLHGQARKSCFGLKPNPAIMSSQPHAGIPNREGRTSVMAPPIPASGAWPPT